MGPEEEPIGVGCIARSSRHAVESAGVLYLVSRSLLVLLNAVTCLDSLVEFGPAESHLAVVWS